MEKLILDLIYELAMLARINESGIDITKAMTDDYRGRFINTLDVLLTNLKDINRVGIDIIKEKLLVDSEALENVPQKGIFILYLIKEKL